MALVAGNECSNKKKLDSETRVINGFTHLHGRRSGVFQSTEVYILSLTDWF